MKKLLITLMFLSICKIEFGQITNSSNSWNYINIIIPTSTCKSSKCYGKYYENYYLKISGDTIIHKKTYKKVLSVTKNSNQSSILGFLREDNNKKVYALLKYIDDSTEVLLYDFTVSKDFVFNSSYTQYASIAGQIEALNRTFFKSKVINVDSVEYSGTKRLRIKFEETTTNWIGDDPVVDTLTWIEGIGSLQGLLNYNMGGSSLLCFKYNSNIMYFNKYGLNCDYSGPVDIVESYDKYLTSICPNPFKDIVTVNSSNQIKQITVYNLNGQKLSQFAPMSNEYQLQLNSFKSGMYIIRIDNNFRKIIKE